MVDTKKTVLITGASPGGIGNAIAREFHSAGLRVIATARSADSLKDLSALGIETLSLEVDQAESVEKCKKELEALTGGGLDYLVNNAGRNYTMPALDIDIAEAAAVFLTNVFAVMRLCQVFAPLLIRSKGTIVQVGSLAGYMPYVFSPVYNASKAALHAYSNTLRVELEPFGVKVIVLVTGGVKSRITRVDRTLPATSYYQPIADVYQRRLTHSQQGAMDTTAYAKSVVGKVLAQERWWHFWKTRNIWEGNQSWVVWFVLNYVGVGWFDIIFKRLFQLARLQRSKIN